VFLLVKGMERVLERIDGTDELPALRSDSLVEEAREE